MTGLAVNANTAVGSECAHCRVLGAGPSLGVEAGLAGAPCPVQRNDFERLDPELVGAVVPDTGTLGLAVTGLVQWWTGAGLWPGSADHLPVLSLCSPCGPGGVMCPPPATQGLREDQLKARGESHAGGFSDVPPGGPPRLLPPSVPAASLSVLVAPVAV